MCSVESADFPSDLLLLPGAFRWKKEKKGEDSGKKLSLQCSFISLKQTRPFLQGPMPTSAPTVYIDVVRETFIRTISADNFTNFVLYMRTYSLTGEKILESPLTNPDFRSTMHSQFHIPPNVLNQKSKVPTLCPESCRMVRGSHRPDLKIPEEQPAERMRVSPDAWQALQCRTFN